MTEIPVTLGRGGLVIGSAELHEDGTATMTITDKDVTFWLNSNTTVGLSIYYGR